MKVFISWSGKRSCLVANLLSEWITDVIQNIDVFVSTDMQRGPIWFSDISEALMDVSDGIVCLTKENLSSPWILFESGAIAKGNRQSRLYTFLVDVEIGDITDPLAQFNHTKPTKEAVYNLINTLNSRLGSGALNDKKLSSAFERNWPFFECEFKKILTETPDYELSPQHESNVLKDVLER